MMASDRMAERLKVLTVTYLALCNIALTHAQTVLNTCNPSTSCQSNSAYAQLPVDNAGDDDDTMYLVGLLSAHEPPCDGAISLAGVQQIEAFLWAVSTFKNRYSGSLSGIRLGAIAFDSCGGTQKVTQQVLNFEQCELAYGAPFPVTPRGAIAYVTAHSDTQILSDLIDGVGKSVLTSGRAEPTYGHDDNSIATLAPSVQVEMQAMARLIMEQEWNYIQVIYSDSPTSVAMLESFTSKFSDQDDVCFVNILQLKAEDSVHSQAVEILESNSVTKVIVVLIEDVVVIENLLRQADSRGSLQQNFVWIFTSYWGTDPNLASNIEGLQNRVLSSVLSSSNTNDVASFQDFYANLPDSRTAFDYTNPWSVDFFRRLDSLNMTAKSLPLHADVGRIIEAADAALQGLHSALLDRCSASYSGLCNDFKNLVNRKDLVNDKIFNLEMDISGTTRRIFNDYGEQQLGVVNFYKYVGTGTRPCGHDCFEQFARYDQLFDNIQFATNQRITESSECPDSPCSQCGETTTSTSTSTAATVTTTLSATPSPSGVTLPAKERLRDGDWVIALLILASIGLLCVVALEFYLMYKISASNTPAKSMWLGQILLFAIFLSFLVLFAYIPTPTKATCGITRFGVGICYSLMFSVLLVKLMVIFSSKNIGYLQGIFQVLMLFFAWGVQIAIDVEWLITNPPNAVIDNSTGVARWVCEHGYKSHVITLSYVMFLIIICTCLALRAHGIVSNYRESVYIGLSAGLTIPIFIAWILLGFLHDDKEFEDPCVAFGLLCTATILLVIIFLPKIHHLNRLDRAFFADEDTAEYTGHTWVGSTGNGVVNTVVAYNDPGKMYGNGISYTAPSTKPPTQPPSVLDGPVMDVDDVDLGMTADEMYKDPGDLNVYRVPYKSNPDALYLRHPGSTHASRAGSVRSLPISQHLQAASLRVSPYVIGESRSLPRHAGEDRTAYVAGESRTLPASGRTLRVTQELAGRTPLERKARSEYNYPTGTARSVISLRSNRTGHSSVRRPRSLQDLGSL